MALCKFSNEFIASSKTKIDNLFISNYLPHLSGDAVKVYIFGLFMCQNESIPDNTFDGFSKVLSIKKTALKTIFAELENEQLIKILTSDPLEIIFFPLNNVLTSEKLYNTSKFADFNKTMQSLFKNQISVSEYKKYYDFLEHSHMEQEALVLIANFCTKLKGEQISHSYVLSVAKAWAANKILSASDVEEKLQETNDISLKLKDLFNVLHIYKNPSPDECNDYQSLIKLGYSYKTLCDLASRQKNCSFAKFVNLINGYAEKNLFDYKAIDNYEIVASREKALAKKVVKSLGQFFSNLDPVIENYIKPWLAMGFSDNVLIETAKLCFKANITTLEGMHTKIKAMEGQNIKDDEKFNHFAMNIAEVETALKQIFNNMQVVKVASISDKSLYRTWTHTYKMDFDLILEAAKLASGKEAPMKYLNKILESCHAQKITTLSDATTKNVLTFGFKQTTNATHKKEITIKFDGLAELKKDLNITKKQS